MLNKEAWRWLLACLEYSAKGSIFTFFIEEEPFFERRIIKIKKLDDDKFKMINTRR